MEGIFKRLLREHHLDFDEGEADEGATLAAAPAAVPSAANAVSAASTASTAPLTTTASMFAKKRQHGADPVAPPPKKQAKAAEKPPKLPPKTVPKQKPAPKQRKPAPAPSNAAQHQLASVPAAPAAQMSREERKMADYIARIEQQERKKALSKSVAPKRSAGAALSGGSGSDGGDVGNSKNTSAKKRAKQAVPTKRAAPARTAPLLSAGAVARPAAPALSPATSVDGGAFSADDEDIVCEVCGAPDDEKDGLPMLLCDGCDRGFHMACVGLRREPASEWFCDECGSAYAKAEHARTQRQLALRRQTAATGGVRVAPGDYVHLRHEPEAWRRERDTAAFVAQFEEPAEAAAAERWLDRWLAPAPGPPIARVHRILPALPSSSSSSSSSSNSSSSSGGGGGGGGKRKRKMKKRKRKRRMMTRQ